MRKMKLDQKTDILRAIEIGSVLAVLVLAGYIALITTGYIGLPLEDITVFMGVIATVLIIAGAGLILYPTPRTTAIGVALCVIGGMVVLDIIFVLLPA